MPYNQFSLPTTVDDRFSAGSIKCSSKTNHVSQIKWSHHFTSPSASLTAGKVSSNIHTLLINARRARGTLSGLHRRSSDMNIRFTRMRQMRSAAGNRFWAAGYQHKFDWRACSHAGPAAWNNLPLHITATIDTETFKTSLNIHLFKLAYSLWLCYASLATWWWSLARHHLGVSCLIEIRDLLTYELVWAIIFVSTESRSLLSSWNEFTISVIALKRFSTFSRKIFWPRSVCSWWLVCSIPSDFGWCFILRNQVANFLTSYHSPQRWWIFSHAGCSPSALMTAFAC